VKVKTSGLGLIVLGILLLGAQLVLYLGVKYAYLPPPSDEAHAQPPHRATPLPAVLGGLSLIAGLTLIAKRSEEANDPRDGLSIPEESHETSRRKAS
jgi:hypothetical protein